MINVNTFVHSALENKNPIIIKCALTVTVVITVAHQPLTPHFFYKSCLKLMHEQAQLSLLFLLIRISSIKFHLAHRAVGIILPCLYRTRQVKAQLKLPSENDAMMAGWMWRFISGCHKKGRMKVCC